MATSSTLPGGKKHHTAGASRAVVRRGKTRRRAMTEAQSASSGSEEQMFGAKEQIPGKARYGRRTGTALLSRHVTSPA